MVTAIIPTWNRRDLLATALGDLRNQTEQPARIIVVDNGSTDDSVAVAESAGAEVVRLPENRGFAPAVNAGIRQASSKWVLILNNDVRLPQNWLATMLDSGERSGAAYVAPKLLQDSHPDLIDGTFDALSRSGFAWRCGNGRPDGPIWSKARPAQFVPLTATLVRRSVFEEAGFLEERNESYYEDVEFFLRCGLRGFSGQYEPAAVARHQGSATLGAWNKDTVFRISRNQRRLTRIYFQKLPVRAVVVGQLLWLLLALRHQCGSASIRGWLAGGRELGDGGIDVSPDVVRRIVTDSESTILEMQQATGFDWFWKTYFRWAG